VNDRIALIGLSGSGKSTVAALVAELLGWRFADSDRFIEHSTGRSIPDIFATDGEPAFRELESGAIVGLLSSGRTVIATGGGAPTTVDGRAALERAFVAWLRISPEAAARRLESNPDTEKRPLLAGGPLDRLRYLAESRRKMYETSADVIIDVDGLTPSEVAAAVVSAWRGKLEHSGEALTNS
jgi:shikimate kinase